MSAIACKVWLSNLEFLFIEHGGEWLRKEMTLMTKMHRARLIEDTDDSNTRETVYVLGSYGIDIKIEILETSVSHILIIWHGNSCRIKTKEKNPSAFTQGFFLE